MRPKPTIRELSRMWGIPIAPESHPVHDMGPLAVIGAPDPPPSPSASPIASARRTNPPMAAGMSFKKAGGCLRAQPSCYPFKPWVAMPSMMKRWSTK
jgi:hypothetical protein